MRGVSGDEWLLLVPKVINHGQQSPPAICGLVVGTAQWPLSIDGKQTFIQALNLLQARA